MQIHASATPPQGARQPELHNFIDDTTRVENAEDVDMAEDAFSAIRAYHSETDRPLVETYAELAADDFDVRKASARVQARWMQTSPTKTPLAEPTPQT